MNCPQRRGNKPTSEKIAKTRRSSSEANSRKEMGAAKSNWTFHALWESRT